MRYKNSKRIVIIAAVALVAIMACGCSLNLGKQELFSSVRAYRTAIDSEYLDYYDETDIILIDPPGNLDESIRDEYLNAYNLINDERNKNGLAPMKWDNTLEWDASLRSYEISYTFSEEHVRPSGDSYFMIDPKNIMGESIYKGYKEADKVVPSLIKNKPDEENFLCEYFTRMGISVYEDGDKNYYWAILFGSDTIKVTFEDEIQTGSVWILQDTENNRGTSVWGTAMMNVNGLFNEFSALIPKASDNKYLFRMIDDGGLYYDTDIPELSEGWKIRLYRSDENVGDSDIHLDIIDENGNVVHECSVFCAAL